MSRLVDGSLFVDTPDGLRLLGSRCTDCNAHTFPRQEGCPRCLSTAMRDEPLSRTGSLWSFTVQEFEPKPPYLGPTEFEPYGVGYIELPGQLIVEARLTENDPDWLRIGMAMELVLLPYRHDDEDEPVLTFAFTPSEQERTR